jgi:WD40 repeat protein
LGIGYFTAYSIINYFFNKKTEWNVVFKNNTKKLIGHSDYITSLAVLSDGTVASGSKDNTIIIWDTTTRIKIKSLKYKAAVNLITALSGGNLAVSYNHKVEIWNVSNEKLIKTLPFGKIVASLAFFFNIEKEEN